MRGAALAVLLALSWACAAEEFSGLAHVDFYAKAGERPSEAFTPVPGPQAGKTALRLDRCSLVGKAPAGLSVELWLRVLGPGSIHDYASGPTGTLCSVGNGHCDGWRLVCLDGKERFSLHIGQPTGPLVLDFRVPESGKWFKLTLVQDGRRVSVLKDGQQLATREFQGKLIPAAALVVGHDVGHGWGSVKFEFGGLASVPAP